MIRGGFVLVLLLVGGCVTAPRPQLPPDLVARQLVLESLPQWQVDGRMGVRFADRGFSGALRWQQQGELIDANFHGPLGAGAFMLQGTSDALVIETGRGERFEYDEPESMMQQQFGWSIPVAAMRYWLLALPAPGSIEHQELSADGNLAALKQRGWTISYDRYVETARGWMPRKIVLTSPDVTIRLAVHQWNLSAN